MVAHTKLEDIVALCKRRGFVYQGSEVYGGLAGTWDYGPLGVALKNNIKQLWWRMFVDERDDVYGIDASILLNAKVVKASGHVDTFTDPLVEDVVTKRRYRADLLLEDAGENPAGLSLEALNRAIKEKKLVSPDGNALGDVRTFNLMCKTYVGATEDESALAYFRPETAQGIFINFKNVVDSMHPKIPFGIAQIGKAYRNEIAPRDFIFRIRELEQMEIEYFVHPNGWEEHFEMWRGLVHEWCTRMGFQSGAVHELEVADQDRAFYSKRTIDFEYEFPFGRKELLGLAYRTDYDLRGHGSASGVDFSYLDEKTGERFVPHVIEPSFGVERAFLAVLTSAYAVDVLGGESRTVLRLPYELAPVKVAVFPLLKNKPELVAKARAVASSVKRVIPHTSFDDNGNIGKRYRRQDEIGTPYCVTIDFETLENDTVTLRDRDSGAQRRVPIANLVSELIA